MVDISIIILTYNTADITLACLSSLITHYQKEIQLGVYEIIVVDNASADNTGDAITKLYGNQDSIKLLKNEKNLGFAKACNLASQQAKGRYLFFLNSDTEVKDRGIQSMVDYLDKQQDVSVLGARLIDNYKKPELSAGIFLSLGNILFLLLGFERLGFLRFAPEKLTTVDWVSGGAMLIRKEVFDTLHGFDEHFFMYVEDMELCYRVQKAHGTVVYFPEMTILHKKHGSADRGFAIIHIYQGIRYFFKKHKGRVVYTVIQLLLNLKAYSAILIGTLTNNTYLVQTYKKALQH